jgi:hypothetical protein
MKKTNLNWRLKELPDAVDVAELVDKKIITPDEGRQLLFNEGKQDDPRKVKQLEEQVEFLKGVVDALTNKTGGTIYCPAYYKTTPWWHSIDPIYTTGNITTIAGNSFNLVATSDATGTYTE